MHDWWAFRIERRSVTEGAYATTIVTATRTSKKQEVYTRDHDMALGLY